MAKDRSWFGDDYTPYASEVQDNLGNFLRVVGVGSVALPIKRSPMMRGARSHNTLHLQQVLHTPDAVCNIIGAPILDAHTVTFGPHGGTIINLSNRRQVGYMKPNTRVPLVRLSGPPVGPKVSPSPFKPDVAYTISMSWSDSERERFTAFMAMDGLPLSPSSHGLEIYNVDHGEECGTISTALMSNQKDVKTIPALSWIDEEGNEVHSGPRLLIDTFFSKEQLARINSKYGSSTNLMISYGLKHYHPNDWNEAERIVGMLMAESSDENESGWLIRF